MRGIAKSDRWGGTVERREPGGKSPDCTKADAVWSFRHGVCTPKADLAWLMEWFAVRAQSNESLSRIRIYQLSMVTCTVRLRQGGSQI